MCWTFSAKLFSKLAKREACVEGTVAVQHLFLSAIGSGKVGLPELLGVSVVVLEAKEEVVTSEFASHV